MRRPEGDSRLISQPVTGRHSSGYRKGLPVRDFLNPIAAGLFCVLLTMLASDRIAQSQPTAQSRLARVGNDSEEIPAAGDILFPARDQRTMEIPIAPNAIVVLQSLDLSGAPHRFSLSTAVDQQHNRTSRLAPVAASRSLPVPMTQCVAEAQPSAQFDGRGHINNAVTPFSTIFGAQSLPPFHSLEQIAPQQPAGLEPACKFFAKAPAVASERRVFEVPRLVGRTFCSVATCGQLMGCRNGVAIYRDETLDCDERLQQAAAQITTLLEGGFRQQVELICGPIDDIDQNGALTFLLTELQPCGEADLNQPPLHGCVRQSDFLSSPGEIGGDIIYLDRELPRQRELAGLLAHEMTHAAIFSRLVERQSLPNGSLTVPGWLNELTAHAVEHRLAGPASSFASRIRSFQQSPESSPISANPHFLSPLQRRGGSRAAAVRLLQFTGGLHGSIPLAIRDAGDSTQLLNSLLGHSVHEVLPHWSRAEADEICRLSPGSLRSLSNDKTTHHVIYGTAFGIFRAGNSASLIQVTCEDDSDWTLTVLPR